MKRSKPLKRTPITRKPVAGKSDRELALRDAWWYAGVKGKRCAVCHTDTQIEGHHVIARQTIKKLAGIEAVWDARNVLAVCAPCHQQHELAARRIRRRLLTEQHWEFATELGVPHLLERYYPED